MTRETKVGLVVAGSFLCLVGIVVASKWNRGDGSDAEEQTVAPGIVQKSTPNAAEAKETAKPEAPTVPGPETPGERRLDMGPAPAGPPTMVIPAAGGTAASNNDVEDELKKQAALRQKERPQQPAETPFPVAKLEGGSGQLPGPLPPLSTPTTPVTPSAGGLITLPPPESTPPPMGGGLPALPPPGGATPPMGGGLPALPPPGGATPPMGGGLPALPPPGGAVVLPPPASAGAIPPPNPLDKDAGNKPGPMPPPSRVGTIEPDPIRPGPIDPVPKPGVIGPMAGGNLPQPVPAVTPKDTTIGPLTPLTDPQKPVIPFNDTKPPPPPPGASSPNPQPGPIPVIPPAGGAVLPSPPIIVGGSSAGVRDVQVGSYECQKGDSTFAILSLRMYGSDKYADALLQYNRDNSVMIKNGSAFSVNPPILNAGQQVLKPPASLLDRDYAALVRSAPQPANPPAAIPKAGNPPPAAGPGGTYTVQNPAGESILDIAQRVFGDRSQWYRIYRVNPNYPPQNLIPAGTQLTLPSN